MNNVVAGIAVVPTLIGIVQVCKLSGMSGRLAPLVSLLLGIAAGIALAYAYQAVGQSMSGPVLVQSFFVGISYGLSASGIYSGVQTMRPTATPAEPPAA